MKKRMKKCLSLVLAGAMAGMLATGCGANGGKEGTAAGDGSGTAGTAKETGIRAVSYTHLDVYKRQCRGRFPRPAPVSGE